MNTIRGRLILILVVAQAVLMPPLLFMIDRTIERTMGDVFVDDARTYGQVFAGDLSSTEVLADPDAIVHILDLAILGGHCVYAALEVEGEMILTTNFNLSTYRFVEPKAQPQADAQPKKGKKGKGKKK